MTELCTWIVPSNVIVMMTGVKYAKKFASGRIELTYTDDTTESARCKETDNLDPNGDFFSIVSAVQSRRKEAKPA